MAGMEIAEAFAFFDSCRFWSLTKASAFCAFETPKPQSREAAEGWQPFVRTSVRRKQGESLGAMAVRCAEKAASRQAEAWRAAPGSGGRCQACGAPGRRGRLLRFEKSLRAPLCPDCRAGLHGIRAVPAKR
jgi:hypothetical protein